MTRILRYAAIFLVCAVALGATAYYVAGPSIRVAKAVESKGADKEAAGHEENSVTMSDAKVAAAGIELLEAKPGELRDSLRLNGIIQPNQETLVQVTPRFPGIVREVRKRLGDKVVKGELLAKVESNQSLTVYELTAPIAGTVIERQAALGEFASEQKPALHRRRPVDRLDRFLGLSPRLRARAARPDASSSMPRMAGRRSRPRSLTCPRSAAATRKAASPAPWSPTTAALRPGLFVTGRVLLSVKPVDIAIKRRRAADPRGKPHRRVRAQRREVRGARGRARRPRRRARRGAVRPAAGRRLRRPQNSFVVKAEIGKGSAAHEH